MPPWLAVAYGLIDFFGNVDFVRENLGGLSPGGATFSLAVFVVGIVWLVIAANRAAEANDLPPAFVSIGRLRRVFLEDRSLGEAIWPVMIVNGALEVGMPKCHEHGDTLEYKPSYASSLSLADAVMVAPIDPTPGRTGGKRSAPTDAVGELLSAGILAGLLPPAPVDAEWEKQRLEREREERERKELGLRPLEQGQTSRDNSGPYCFACGSLRKIPKSIYQCQREIERLVVADLRKEFASACT